MQEPGSPKKTEGSACKGNAYLMGTFKIMLRSHLDVVITKLSISISDLGAPAMQCGQLFLCISTHRASRAIIGINAEPLHALSGQATMRSYCRVLQVTQLHDIGKRERIAIGGLSNLHATLASRPYPRTE